MDSVYSLDQRRWLRFWLGLGLVSLLLGFGHFAPFYRLVYALPFLQLFANPVKFLALVNLAIVVLFAYGADGLWRKYMAVTKTGLLNPWAALKSRWSVPGAERNWLVGCLLLLAGSLAAWGLYAFCRESLVDYLHNVTFSAAAAERISRFSVRQVGWFVVFFGLAAGLVAFILSGIFSGARAKWGAVLLGLLLALDLGRANQPWIVYSEL